MIDNQNILDAKHITLVTSNNSFANASALYTYILTQHKKVSIVSNEEIDIKYKFLPWFDKIRKVSPSSSDYTIVVDEDVKELYLFLSTFKINKKMALALYTALCDRYKFFTSDSCDGTEFALATKLIELGADFKLVNNALQNSLGLNFLRLKSYMLKDMLLVEDANVANLFVDEKLLKLCGADEKDAFLVMEEVLRLKRVSKVTLIRKEDDKIVKTLSKGYIN